MTPEFVPTKEDKEMSFEINALLTALHQGDTKLFHSLLKLSDDHNLLLIGALATVHSICNTLIEAVNDSEHLDNVTFEQFIEWTVEYLLED